MFNHRRIPTGSFPQNFVKIRLDLAEILRISKLDWRDGGEGKKGRREEGEKGRRGRILLCNGLTRSNDKIVSWQFIMVSGKYAPCKGKKLLSFSQYATVDANDHSNNNLNI